MTMFIENKKMISFVSDWVVLAVVLILLWIAHNIEPFERQFKLDDVTISHPYKGDTVKMNYLVAGGLVISFIVITGFQYYKKNLRYNYHQALIGVSFAIAISTLFSHIIKVFVGRYRPDFISVCKVDFDKVQEHYNTFDVSTGINYGPRNLFDTSICTSSKEELFEERKSFPSGHSSFAFSVMSYLSFYIAGQIHLMDKKSYVWKYFVVSVPYMIATMVALSRVFDYRHHWQDVTIGSIIGLFFGIITYYYYFPSLYSAKCDIPYQRYEYIPNDEDERRINFEIDTDSV